MSRPKLGEVLHRETAAKVPEQTRPPEAMVQLNVSVPASLRKAVRIQALQEGRDVSAVVRELLTEWLTTAPGRTDG